MEGLSLLPDPSIKRHRQVFDDDDTGTGLARERHGRPSIVRIQGISQEGRLCSLSRGARRNCIAPGVSLSAETAADANVTKSKRLHSFDRVDVAQVDDGGRGQAGLDPSKVKSAELVPLSYDDRRIRAFNAGVGILRKLDAREQRLCGSNTFRIVGDNACARCLQLGRMTRLGASRMSSVLGL